MARLEGIPRDATRGIPGANRLIRVTDRMANPDEARSYVEQALPRGRWIEVSERLGRNHAYIQQYLRYGKPLYLAPEDRALLVEMYGLDPARMAPPPKSARPLRVRVPREKAKHQRGDNGDVDVTGLDILAGEPGAREIVLAYLRIKGKKERDLALRLVTSLESVALDSRTVSPDKGADIVRFRSRSAVA